MIHLVEQQVFLHLLKQEQQEHIKYIVHNRFKSMLPGEQDGIYHLLIINNSNSPTVSPFSTERFSQSIQQLYPQTNRDNPKI